MNTGKYWSVDAFLSEEENVAVKLKCDAKNLAYLDPQSEPGSKHMEKGRELKIPLWLAVPLAQKDFVDIATPNYFGNAYKDTMKADPTTLNLKERCQYLYEVGLRLAQYIGDESLTKLLGEVFQLRYRKILDSACSTKVSDTPLFALKLTATEKDMFTHRQEYLQQYDVWKNRRADKIQINKEVLPTAKRWKLK